MASIGRRSSLPDEAATVFSFTNPKYISTLQDIERSSNEGFQIQPWSTVKWRERAIDWTDNLSDSSSMASPKQRGITDKFGILTLVTIILASITLLATGAFLWWFWLISHGAIHGDPPPPIWWKIVHKSLVTQVVTISTAVMRSSISLQAGIITAMVASLLLEHQGSRIETFPMLSILRGVYTSPLTFFYSVWGNWPPLRAWTFIWLLAISLIITLESQFFSTILATDIKSSQVSFNGDTTLVAGLDDSSKLRDTGLWMRRPAEFPVFAERRNLYIPEDGMFETGHTYRAFLPLQTPKNRTNLRKFQGGAMLFDARVACVPPNLKIRSAHKYGDPYASNPAVPSERAFQGTVGLNISEYPFLDKSYLNRSNKTKETIFNCTISLPPQGTVDGIGNEWTIGLCTIDPVFRLNYKRSRYPEALLTQDVDPT
jgi:hypothetical protein